MVSLAIDYAECLALWPSCVTNRMGALGQGRPWTKLLFPALLFFVIGEKASPAQFYDTVGAVER